jgi:hypothetical protein
MDSNRHGRTHCLCNGELMILSKISYFKMATN